LILDNLIAEGKAKPMIILMPDAILERAALILMPLKTA
jgi:hypothetical protein